MAARAVRDGAAPLAAAGCARRGQPAALEVGGAVDTLFDLASVTKSMTAVAVLLAGLDLSTPLGVLVAEARGTASEELPLELFLAHRAGLEAHAPLYAPLVLGVPVDAPRALATVADTRRTDALGACPPGGFAPVYSDLGYALAGVALARATGAVDAGEAIERLVIEPLGLSARAGTARGLTARGVPLPFAPTEDVGWRGGIIAGVVHDENAWALTGHGGSGHAGIFGTVDAVITFGLFVLDHLARFEPLLKLRPGGTLRAGFDGKSDEGSSAGTRMGPRAFGHLGFTGTSLWIDPDLEVVVSLLTNRVCPSRDNAKIRAARPVAHDALVERAMRRA